MLPETRVVEAERWWRLQAWLRGGASIPLAGRPRCRFRPERHRKTRQTPMGLVGRANFRERPLLMPINALIIQPTSFVGNIYRECRWKLSDMMTLQCMLRRRLSICTFLRNVFRGRRLPISDSRNSCATSVADAGQDARRIELCTTRILISCVSGRFVI